MLNSLQMRFFKPDLSSLGGVFKAPKLGPRHDKMAAHVSESPTTVLLPKGYDDIVNCFFPVVHHSLWGSHILFSRSLRTFLDRAEYQSCFIKIWLFPTFIAQYFLFIACAALTFLHHLNINCSTFSTSVKHIHSRIQDYLKKSSWSCVCAQYSVRQSGEIKFSTLALLDTSVVMVWITQRTLLKF